MFTAWKLLVRVQCGPPGPSARCARGLARTGISGLALLALGCGPADGPAPEAAANEPPAPRSEPAGASRRRSEPAALTVSGEEPYESSEFGALHGTILFRGEEPERFLLGASASAECKHHPDVDQRSNVVLVQEGKLAGVFVTLASGYDRARIPPVPDAPATLRQQGCMYVPRVLALRAGQVLRVTNEDPTSHNVHTRPKRGSDVNQNMGAEQAPLELSFERPERPVPFSCDIHPWMGAAVFVEEHPWFAVTDEHGAFRIADVPPGSYVVEAVHESLGKISGSVSVVAGSSTGFTLTLPE